MRAFSCIVLGGALALASGCSSSGTPETGTFGATPASVVTSDAGSLRIAIQSAPDAVPSRGTNTLRLVVTHVPDGSPAAGLDLEVVPWMPAMGHGASVKPTVEPGAEPGTYTVSNVNLFMPGLWEIRTTIGGSISDHATSTFDIR